MSPPLEVPLLKPATFGPVCSATMIKTDGTRTPEAYLHRLEEPRRSDVRALHELIRREAPQLEPHASDSGIGYGKYHYRYRTGREGDWWTIALVSQKRYISLYVSPSGERGQYIAEAY